MDHPPYFTPEQKFLRTIYVGSLSSVEASETFAAWLLTGVAAMLGLILANAESVAKIISSGALRWGIVLLTISMLAGVIAKQFGIAIRNAMALTVALYAELLSPDGQAIVESISANPSKIVQKMSEPFLWPLKGIMLKAAQAGSDDYLHTEKRCIRMLCWQMYSSAIQGVTAAIGILFLSFGIQ